MDEKEIVSMTNEPNTTSSLKDALFELGIAEGDILLVHSSMSSLGWVCGGAQAVISALMAAAGSEGTIVMPAHSGDWSDPMEWGNPPVPEEWFQAIYESMPAFDRRITPTRGVGRIPELFRTNPSAIRSDHPQVSFSAAGRNATDIVIEHPLSPSLGMDSPLGRMYSLDAKVLLLGVGYSSCTSFHLAETLIEEMPTKRMGTAVTEDGERLWKWFRDFEYDSEDFEKLGEDFEFSSVVRRGKVGNAECRLFSLKSGVDYARGWLQENRFHR